MAHIGSSIITGKTEVAEEQKPVRLTETQNIACLEVQLTADPSNVGAICAVGDKNVNAKKTLGTTRGIIFEKKQSPVRIEIDDPTKLYVDVEKGKDVITWVAVLA